MNNALPSCSSCNAPLLGNIFNLPELVPCPSCGKPLQVEIFPAMFRPVAQGRDGELVLDETESSCFFHPQKKAVVPCDGCGRFLCALCDCELNGRHYCPACIEGGMTKGKMENLQNRRPRYDNLALFLAIVPFVTIFGMCFTIFTAPAAFYISIRHWKTPGSLVRTSKIRFILAMIFAVLILAGWVFYFLELNFAAQPVKKPH